MLLQPGIRFYLVYKAHPEPERPFQTFWISASAWRCLAVNSVADAALRFGRGCWAGVLAEPCFEPFFSCLRVQNEPVPGWITPPLPKPIAASCKQQRQQRERDS